MPKVITRTCPECGISGGHRLSCGLAPEPIRRMHARIKAGNFRIEYAGRDEELAYLRDAIAKETDAETRDRMRERLEYVERTSDETLHQQMTGRPRPS